MMAEVITPEILAPRASPKIEGIGVVLAYYLLGNLRRSRHAAHGCNSDDRIVIAPLDEVHDVPSNDSADTGEQQCAHTQYQQFKNFRVEQQMCVAKYA